MLFTLSVSANIWKDDFEREELGKDWTPTTWCAGDAPFNWNIDKGIIKGCWPNWDAQMLFLTEYPSLDYTIQVKCRIDKVWMEPGLAGAGFIFRSTGPEFIGGCIGPFYGYFIGSPQCGFMICDGGGWQITGAIPEKHNPDQWYTLKLVVKGDDFFTYVDDKPVCRLSDGRFRGKFVGLSIGSNIDASFDDFMISDRVDDQALIDFDVQAKDKLTTSWGYIKQK
jgi:hypothetical protein